MPIEITNFGDDYRRFIADDRSSSSASTSMVPVVTKESLKEEIKRELLVELAEAKKDGILNNNSCLQEVTEKQLTRKIDSILKEADGEQEDE